LLFATYERFFVDKKQCDHVFDRNTFYNIENLYFLSYKIMRTEGGVLLPFFLFVNHGKG
jgi:hypothetical protein